MNCQSCGDKGIIWLDWADADPEFALCLCQVGMQLRRAENNGTATVPLWRVWCAREQVDPSRVFRMEDVLSAQELRERGFSKPPDISPQTSREAALLAAGKRKAKL